MEIPLTFLRKKKSLCTEVYNVCLSNKNTRETRSDPDIILQNTSSVGVHTCGI